MKSDLMILIDPAWHADGYSEAVILSKGKGVAVHQKNVRKHRGCDIHETVCWIEQLLSEYPAAELKIVDNGPGIYIIELLMQRGTVRR